MSIVTSSAPPPPAPRTPDHDVDPPDAEALTREARVRTRHRRQVFGRVVIVAIVSLVCASAIAFAFARTTGSRGPETGAGEAGVVPASPVTGVELVASFYTHHSAGGRDRWIYVYDNGLVVSKAAGWQVQRLTPDGVDRLSARIIASGIMGEDRYADAPETWSGAFVQLRIDGVMAAAWLPPPAEAQAFISTVGQLVAFEDWLPAEAWALREPMAWLPPGYAVCAGPSYPAAEAEQDAVLHLLPERAAAVLAARPRFGAIDPEVDAYAGSWSKPTHGGCRQLTPTQSQFVVDVLVREGWRPGDGGPPSEGERVLLADRTDTLHLGTDTGAGSISVAFVPILPHGVPECACYG